MSAFMKSLLRRADLGRASHQPPIRHPATPLATPLEATPLDTQPLQPPHWTPSRCAHRSLDVQSPFLPDARHLTRPINGLLRRYGRPKDRKSTRLNSSHVKISYAVFC